VTGLLEGKSAIVYGSGGIGRGVARTFAAEGAKVFIAGRKHETLDAAVEEISSAGGSVEATVLDATDEQAVDAGMAALRRAPEAGDVAAAAAFPRLRPGGRHHRDDGERDLWARAQVIDQPTTEGDRIVDLKLELVLVPVSDVDRAKTFYTEKLGFDLDVDHRAGEEFRVVQLTPPGSACSITIGIGITDAAPGSYRGTHLVVADIEAARAELVGRGVDVSEIRHMGPNGWEPGPDPERRDYGSFADFSDPDGNTWVLQERRSDAGA
jgi:NAD(P)-dependent dehydrogenase (short-subunit alcohol dehydrogenase family)